MALKKLSRSIAKYKANTEIDDKTFYEFLKFIKMSEYEINCLVLPMIHMFVAMSFPEIREMPARFLVDHLYYHKLLHHSSLTAWRGWENGTITYISKLQASIKGKIHTSAKVKSIERRSDGKVLVHFGDEAAQEFDMVIMATPPASTFKLLQEPTQVEEELLSPWVESDLHMCIHKDDSVLPARSRYRGFWNPYIDVKSDTCGASYLINKLQPKVGKDIVVSWEPIQKINLEKQLYSKQVTIARYTDRALKTRPGLPALNKQRHGIYYCGAHFGFGWHESGVVSAIDVTERITQDLMN